MKIPHYYQEKKYTCGPAAIKMVLASFGIKKTEAHLAKILKTSAKTGTNNKNILEFLEKQKFSFIVERGSRNAKRLQQLIKRRYRIIINYHYEDHEEGHLAVVKKVGRKHIHLLDPWKGPDYKLTIDYFKTVWFDDEHNEGWFVAIKN